MTDSRICFVLLLTLLGSLKNFVKRVMIVMRLSSLGSEVSKYTSPVSTHALCVDCFSCHAHVISDN